LSNVVVLEGAESSTNLPSACCDAIFLRDAYHHLTRPQEFDASLLAALKPGGRLAIMDFPPEPGQAVSRDVRETVMPRQPAHAGVSAARNHGSLRKPA
jgi:SAM-dependent methyltransferase